MRKVETKNPKFYYFISRESPKLLIHSGTHGDESEVTDFVMESVIKYEKLLPPFIFVPMVSPSAVEMGTRENENGTDMNRGFFSDSKDSEVQTNIEVIKGKKFELFVSFHEDPLERNYYLYDVGYRKTASRLVLKHNQWLKEMGIRLLNGVDDPTDPKLGYEFKGGYKKFVHPQKYHDDGTISAWVLNRRIAEDYLLPEIPGKLDRETKKLIVDSFFAEVIVKSADI